MASGTFALWLCNGFVACLIFGVLGLRKWRKQRFTMSDSWLAVALTCNALRMVGDYYVNKYGTPLSYAVYLATVPPAEAATLDLELTQEQARGIVLTGKLLIPTRVAITVVIWSLNLAVLDVLRKTLLRRSEYKQQLFWSMYTVLALTFFVTILAAFIECQPLQLNWTLLPDVVNCSFGTAWILTYEISNITIDFTMGFILVFLLLKPQTPKQERIKLSVLGLWVLWGVVIMIRVIQGESFTDILKNRIVWGSVEVVFAASVATLPTIYILMRPGPDGMQCDLGKEVHRVSQGSTAAIALVGEASQQADWPLQQGVSWDNPGDWSTSISTDTRSMQGNARKSIQRTSTQSSMFNPLSIRVGDRNSWQAFRDTIRHPRPGSRLSLGIRATDDNLHDVLAGWIELDEMDTDSLSREASSPEPEDVEGRDGGIFVATEIHRTWEEDCRPRIITIPRRAKLNRNMA
ncbi:hypothetical protein FHL15_009436 [Xylaria flabelliformis]|uniref:Rhodopsin domain-containing protein n=1 Tax=Xylaria flabelliformis TaxID=2512241 RepID=A0A553HP14_9PEZI|nr:hypothetical protein FHL15_009436 [Xylaria flabelliformis]